MINEPTLKHTEEMIEQMLSTLSSLGTSKWLTLKEVEFVTNEFFLPNLKRVTFVNRAVLNREVDSCPDKCHEPPLRSPVNY